MFSMLINALKISSYAQTASEHYKELQINFKKKNRVVKSATKQVESFRELLWTRSHFQNNFIKKDY